MAEPEATPRTIRATKGELAQVKAFIHFHRGHGTREEAILLVGSVPDTRVLDAISPGISAKIENALTMPTPTEDTPCSDVPIEKPEKGKNRKYPSMDLARWEGNKFLARVGLFEEQRGVCPLCSLPLFLGLFGGPRYPVLDHDHLTREVRGVLHSNCNLVLAAVESGSSYYKGAKIHPAFLMRAVAYLKTHGTDLVSEFVSPTSGLSTMLCQISERNVPLPGEPDYNPRTG